MAFWGSTSGGGSGISEAEVRALIEGYLADLGVGDPLLPVTIDLDNPAGYYDMVTREVVTEVAEGYGYRGIEHVSGNTYRTVCVGPPEDLSTMEHLYLAFYSVAGKVPGKARLDLTASYEGSADGTVLTVLFEQSPELTEEVAYAYNRITDEFQAYHDEEAGLDLPCYVIFNAYVYPSMELWDVQITLDFSSLSDEPTPPLTEEQVQGMITSALDGRIVALPQSEYDALPTPRPAETIYVITED